MVSALVVAPSAINHNYHGVNLIIIIIIICRRSQCDYGMGIGMGMMGMGIGYVVSAATNEVTAWPGFTQGQFHSTRTPIDSV